MVITSSGEVLTNNHVIDGATSVNVTIASGKSYSAKVLGYDATDDVALLQVDGAPKLPTITTSSAKPSVGDSVLALGNALGKGGTPATAPGQVTEVNQTSRDGRQRLEPRDAERPHPDQREHPAG